MARPPFPHMMPGDIPLFSMFVLTPEGGLYKRWEFDVHVGQGYLTSPEYDPIIRNLSLEVTRLRIDAVGWDGQIPTIFEVKPQAGLGALGQLIGYRYYWRKERFTEPRIALITDSTTPDLQELYAHEGVNLHIVQDADLSQIILACQIVGQNCTQLIIPPTP